MFDDSGFSCLGAEETTKDKAIAVLKKEGPGLFSSIVDAASGKKPDAIPPDVSTKSQARPNELSRNAKIGIGVGAGAAALLGGFLLWKLT